jgi:hypothetical protein
VKFFSSSSTKKDSHMNFNGCGRDVEICWTYPIAWIRNGLWGCIDDISAQLYLLSMIWFHCRMDVFQFGVIILHHNISKVTWHRCKSHPSSSQHLNLFYKLKKNYRNNDVLMWHMDHVSKIIWCILSKLHATRGKVATNPIIKLWNI